MDSFSYLEPVCCSMSSSNYCFLTCIQVSQEAGQVVWYSHLLQNFPLFIVIHTVKGFGIASKAEIDVISIQLRFAFWTPVTLTWFQSPTFALLPPTTAPSHTLFPVLQLYPHPSWAFDLSSVPPSDLLDQASPPLETLRAPTAVALGSVAGMQLSVCLFYSEPYLPLEESLHEDKAWFFCLFCSALT